MVYIFMNKLDKNVKEKREDFLKKYDQQERA